VPATYQKHYDDVNPSDTVRLDPKFCDADSEVAFVSSASAAVASRQKVKKDGLEGLTLEIPTQNNQISWFWEEGEV